MKFKDIYKIELISLSLINRLDNDPSNKMYNMTIGNVYPNYPYHQWIGISGKSFYAKSLRIAVQIIHGLIKDNPDLFKPAPSITYYEVYNSFRLRSKETFGYIKDIKDIKYPQRIRVSKVELIISAPGNDDLSI